MKIEIELEGKSEELAKKIIKAHNGNFKVALYYMLYDYAKYLGLVK